MDRVSITQCVVGICFMQVCAVNNATDEEILEVCNRENPSGTINGWVGVVREGRKEGPVKCDKYEDRTHFLVYC